MLNIIIRISFSSSYFSTFQYIVQVLTTYTHTVICWYSSLLLLFFSLWVSWFQKLIQIVTNTNWTSELKILHTWGSKHQNNGSSHSRQKDMIYYSLSTSESSYYYVVHILYWSTLTRGCPALLSSVFAIPAWVDNFCSAIGVVEKLWM